MSRHIDSFSIRPLGSLFFLVLFVFFIDFFPPPPFPPKLLHHVSSRTIFCEFSWTLGGQEESLRPLQGAPHLLLLLVFGPGPKGSGRKPMTHTVSGGVGARGGRRGSRSRCHCALAVLSGERPPSLPMRFDSCDTIVETTACICRALIQCCIVNTMHTKAQKRKCSFIGK